MDGVLHSLKQRARQCPFFSARTAQPSAAALWLAIAHLASRPLSVIIGSSEDRCAALDAGLLWPSLCATLGAEHFCQAQGRLWCRVADVDWSPLPEEAGLGAGSESWLVRRQEAPLPGWSRRLALTARRFYFQCVRLRWESGAMIKNRICCRLPFTPTTQENIHRNSLVPVLFTPQPFTRLWTKPQGKTSNWTLKYLKSLIAGFRIIFQWLTSIGQSTSGGVGYKHLRCNINENGRLNSF